MSSAYPDFIIDKSLRDSISRSLILSSNTQLNELSGKLSNGDIFVPLNVQRKRFIRKKNVGDFGLDTMISDSIFQYLTNWAIKTAIKQSFFRRQTDFKEIQTVSVHFWEISKKDRNNCKILNVT